MTGVVSIVDPTKITFNILPVSAVTPKNTCSNQMHEPWQLLIHSMECINSCPSMDGSMDHTCSKEEDVLMDATCTTTLHHTHLVHCHASYSASPYRVCVCVWGGGRGEGGMCVCAYQIILLLCNTCHKFVYIAVCNLCVTLCPKRHVSELASYVASLSH